MNPKVIAVVASVCLALSTSAQAATITILNTQVVPGGLVDIPILISGGETIQGAQINFKVEDPDNDAGVITINNAFIGSIWAGTASAMVLGEAVPTGDDDIIYNIMDLSNTAIANGVLATIRLDLTNAILGGEVTLNPEFNSTPPDDTFLLGAVAGGAQRIEPTVVSGVLTLVPEPTSLLLLLAGACGMGALRGRRARAR